MMARRQPTIIKSLEKQFGGKVAKKKMTITPGTPGFIGGKVDDMSKVDETTQSMYRSGVGTLLYLTKHSRPDITNPVRELSKSMDGASMAHVIEMYRVINFLLETKTLGLRMVPIFNDGIWKLEALSDSDLQMIRTQDTVSMDTSFIFVVFQWHGRVKA